VEIASLYRKRTLEYAISSGATAILLVMLADVGRSAFANASTAVGHDGIFSQPVLCPLLDMSVGSKEVDSPDPILGGPSLRFLSALCHDRKDASVFRMDGTELLSGYHRALLQFDDGGESDRLVLIDAISSFALLHPRSLLRLC